MKKHLIFTVSFIFLFLILTLVAKVLYGMYLTSIYVPNIDEAWNMNTTASGQVKYFSRSSPIVITLVLALVSAAVAYFISHKFTKRSYNIVE